MSEEKKIINNVEVIEDGDITHFVPVEEPKKESKEETIIDNRPWYKKLYDWWNDIPVKPYVKVRDLADPFGDQDLDGGGKSAIEAGIKISF